MLMRSVGRLSAADESWADGDPLVTVYIPTHNRAELLLDRALPSVQAQTYRNIEIIVAAHGCTDDTHKRVHDVIPTTAIFGPPQDHRVRIIYVPRRPTYPPTAENHWFAGPVAPCNAALKAARGDWIMRIDDDDKLEPDAVEDLLRWAQVGNHEFVSAAYKTHKGIVWDDGETPPAGGIQTCMYRSYLKFMRYNPDCWRKSWNQVNDVDLIDRFRKAGVRMGHLNQVVAEVIPRPGETKIGLAAYQANEDRTARRMAF